MIELQKNKLREELNKINDNKYYLNKYNIHDKFK